MKKILMLGGSAQQVVAIEIAKQLGYYTVLCDYLPDNPGQYVADKFYLASTTDKEQMLKIAKEEQVDGVVAYASDPAAPSAARGYTDAETALTDREGLRLPVIVKPVDSSGSKGATVLQSWEHYAEALEFAFSFSRSKRVVVEEYIEKNHPYLIGGDLFVWDGKVILWGLLNCHRDSRVNPLVPVGKSYPPKLSETDLEAVKATLQTMIDKLHIRSGAMNVELVVDKEGNVWPIDIGPRNGGNMIPDLLGMIFGVDVVKITILAAMGEIPCTEVNPPVPFYATHNLHSDKDGRFRKVVFSKEIEPYIIRKCIYKKPGDSVAFFDNASKALGIVFFHFDSAEVMEQMLGSIHEHITIELE